MTIIETMIALLDYNGDLVRHGDRVLAAYALGKFREGLVIGTRPDGHIVVQFTVLESDAIILASGSIRVP